MRRATVSTPNLDELSTLVGRPILQEELDISDAASELIEGQGCGAILATGCKLPGGLIIQSGGEPISTDELLFDFLYAQQDGWKSWEYWAKRIDTIHDHGTGCTLASAIATGLGQGMALPDAIARARDFVRAALLAAPGLGQGHGPMGYRAG
jgi:hydroxymethylpyrimidine/phosphomethylpyrimidine kinase